MDECIFHVFVATTQVKVRGHNRIDSSDGSEVSDAELVDDRPEPSKSGTTYSGGEEDDDDDLK